MPYMPYLALLTGNEFYQEYIIIEPREGEYHTCLYNCSTTQRKVVQPHNDIQAGADPGGVRTNPPFLLNSLV